MAAKRPAKRKKLDPQGPLRAHVRELRKALAVVKRLAGAVDRAKCRGRNVRNGTPCARAALGVSRTSTPPTVKASAPIAAPFMKARRSICSMQSSL